MSFLVSRSVTLVVLLLVVSFLGCGGDLVPAGNEPATESATSAPASSSTGGQRIEAVGLVFDMPADWVSETPTSSMRIVQASIPGSGDAGQFTVFHFGEGGGGGVEPNLQRWIGQMEPDTSEEPERQTVEAGNYRSTWIDVTGTLKASTIGSFPATDQPGYEMFGAVVEGPGGPWFLRAVGPQETMAPQRDAFVAMLQSARAE